MVLVALCVLSAAYLMRRARVERQKELLRMQKLRGSVMYQTMYPLVRHCRRCDIDQVRIERDMVIFTAVCPPGTLGVFDISSRFGSLSLRRTRALASVIGEDIPVLNDRRCYALRRYRITRPNGAPDYGYTYTIRSPYKSSIMRARAARGVRQA